MSDLTILKEVGLQADKFNDEQLTALKKLSKEQLQAFMEGLPLETFKKETFEKLSQFTPEVLSAARKKLLTSPIDESAEALIVKFANESTTPAPIAGPAAITEPAKAAPKKRRCTIL